MENTEKLLDVRGLRTAFRIQGKTVQAVRGVDFSIRAGEIVGVVGESGSGKSVTMKSIIKMLPDSAVLTADAIEFGGQDLMRMTEKQMCGFRGNEISMIFQDPMTSLNPLRRVGDHIVEVLRRHGGLGAREARRQAVEMLGLVGVPSAEDRMRQYPHEFSGGMRQRVLIAMALACKPRLLIADEPTTALDVTIQAQILDLIRDLQQKSGMAVVLITHDLGIVASLCKRLMVMYGGLIMEAGSIEDIFYRPMHPYTRALLRSVPSIDSQKSQRLIPIDGQAPSLIDPPPGCPFAPRCPLREPACERAIPDFAEYGPGRRARCPVTQREART
jgi:oligopeptide/dipeptide ABC transporter ATP-binding protein